MPPWSNWLGANKELPQAPLDLHYLWGLPFYAINNNGQPLSEEQFIASELNNFGIGDDSWRRSLHLMNWQKNKLLDIWGVSKLRKCVKDEGLRWTMMEVEIAKILWPKMAHMSDLEQCYVRHAWYMIEAFVSDQGVHDGLDFDEEEYPAPDSLRGSDLRTEFSPPSQMILKDEPQPEMPSFQTTQRLESTPESKGKKAIEWKKPHGNSFNSTEYPSLEQVVENTPPSSLQENLLLPNAGFPKPASRFPPALGTKGHIKTEDPASENEYPAAMNSPPGRFGQQLGRRSPPALGVQAHIKTEEPTSQDEHPAKTKNPPGRFGEQPGRHSTPAPGVQAHIKTEEPTSQDEHAAATTSSSGLPTRFPTIPSHHEEGDDVESKKTGWLKQQAEGHAGLGRQFSTPPRSFLPKPITPRSSSGRAGPVNPGDSLDMDSLTDKMGNMLSRLGFDETDHKTLAEIKSTSGKEPFMSGGAGPAPERPKRQNE